MLEDRRTKIEEELERLDETLQAALAEINEDDDAILKLEEGLVSAREIREKHRTQYNLNVGIERDLKAELAQVKTEIEEERRQNFISDFMAKQPGFDGLAEEAFKSHIEDLSNAYSHFDGETLWKQLYRDFKNNHNFSDHVLAYRAAKTRYETQLEAIGELFYRKQAVPLAQSNALTETYIGLARNAHVLRQVGAV